MGGAWWSETGGAEASNDLEDAAGKFSKCALRLLPSPLVGKTHVSGASPTNVFNRLPFPTLSAEEKNIRVRLNWVFFFNFKLCVNASHGHRWPDDLVE